MAVINIPLNTTALQNIDPTTLSKTAELLTLDPSRTLSLLQNIGMFLVGMVIYSLFTYAFYRFISKRDLISMDLSKYRGGDAIILGFLYMIEYVLIVPVVVFVSFIILSGLLLILSKTNNVAQVLTIAISVVGAVRITSYFSENLSQDIAKMLPLALLGVFLTDTSSFSIINSVSAASVALKSIDLWITLVYYLGFLIIIEFIVRILYLIILKIFFRKGKTLTAY